MIEYRPFRNIDPPKIVALWDRSDLQRGAATGLRTDAFETINFSQSYFDRNGLIVAIDDGKIIGYVHAGFGQNADGSALEKGTGVIAAVVVDPEYRRRGIGRELVRRAENYLSDAGASTIFAGQAEPLDPFYFGLYGGCQPSGFLLTDENADPFLRAVGYSPFERHFVFQRDLTIQNDPMSVRLVNIRRQMQLAIAYHRQEVSWWWITRLGRLDSVRFQLVPKGGGDPVATVTVLGLDLYLGKWEERAIGLLDLQVNEDQRREGYGQALLLEVCRRMREEMVTRVEAHAAETNIAAVELLRSSGFEQVDTGVVYQRIFDADDEPAERTIEADDDETSDDDETFVGISDVSVLDTSVGEDDHEEKTVELTEEDLQALGEKTTVHLDVSDLEQAAREQELSQDKPTAVDPDESPAS